MREMRVALFVGLMAAVGCNSGETAEPAATGAEAPAAAAGEAEAAPTEGTAAANTAPAEGNAAAAAAGDPAPDTWENGVFTSPRFNVRFNLPEGWQRAGAGDSGPAGLGTSDDSISFLGPEGTGLRLVVANSESIQLVDSSFNNVTETIGFENVRIVPDASQARTFNGVPGYRTEADAHLRGDPVPQYLIAQALELPGSPTMFTVFVPGDQYDLHSDTMKAILDSIEVLNLRPQ